MPGRPKTFLQLKELVVVVPHSGIVIPSEIPLESLSNRLAELLRNVDWYTNWLYDFRDILDNRHLDFPYTSLLLEANRHPDILEDCVPLHDVYGEPVYKPEQEPSEELRKHLSHKYLVAFHKQIEAAIVAGAEFLLDGHSTVATRGVAANQIDLMNFQHSRLDDGPKFFSPMVYVETYAEELQKRLPEVNVTVNASEYFDVYGHVCAEHSVNAVGRVGKRVPVVTQETCECLYINPDHTPNVEALNRLRRAFAEAVRATVQSVKNLNKTKKMIDLHSLRQTYDYDCGVTALQTILAYYGIEEREDTLLVELEVDKKSGTRLEKFIEVAEAKGFQVQAGQNWSIEDIRRHVSEERPVIVLLQAWADEYMTLEDWRKNYDDGHYAIVMGYNKNVLFFEDPSSLHRTWLKESEFLARWHDKDPVTGEKIIRFGMVLLGRDPIGKVVHHME